MLKQTAPTLPVDMLPARRAFVAFTEKTDLPLLRRFLPRGFRHCSVHVHDGVRWTSMESLAGYVEVMSFEAGADFDLPQFLRGQGFTVVEAQLRRDDRTHRMQWPAIFTCVELVKRVLGLRKPLILFPSQLYRALVKAGAR